MGPSNGAPGLRWFFFGFSGRISRLPYLLGFLFPVFFAAGIVRRLDMLPEDSGEFLFWGFVLVFSAPAVALVIPGNGVKRLHDINIPGPVVICLFVPAVSLIAMLVLFCGPEPEAPTTMAKTPIGPKGAEMTQSDPAALLATLIKCPSVTPKEAGVLTALGAMLQELGFRVERVISKRKEQRVENLYARLGETGPHLMFAGHTDVVPEGDPADWSHPPFAAEVHDGLMFGRGTVDMKGGDRLFRCRDRPLPGG